MGHKKIIVTFIILLLINGIELQNEYPYQEQLPPNMYSNVLPENNPIYMDYQSQPVYQDLQQSAMYPEVQQPAMYPDMQQPDLQGISSQTVESNLALREGRTDIAKALIFRKT